MTEQTPAQGPAQAPAQGLASRRAAYRALRRVQEQAAFSPPVVQRAVSTLPPRERAFAASLIYETLRWQGTLDWALGQVLTRPIDEVEPPLRDLLRMAAWQVLYGRMPDRAVVDTAVALARGEIGERVAGFTNGVLRNLVRRKDDLPWPPAGDDRGLALATGYPEWIAAQARARFGDRARAVLEAGNDAPGLTLRVTVPAGQSPAEARERLVAELREDGVAAEPGRFAPEAVRAPGADPMALAAVQEGRATPQDEASMLVARAVVAALAAVGGAGASGRDRDAASAGGASLAEAIGASPTDATGRVADLCAGPGGKSTHLAQLGLHVTAADPQPARARMVAELAERLGVADRVQVLERDGRRHGLPAESFDAVLVDAPCSGLGVTRRRPEVRWRRTPDDPARLAKLQLELLSAAASLVRPGGVLVYSVCTWPVAETADVAQAFLAVEGDRFAPVDPAVPLPAGAGTRLPGDLGVQLSPDTDGTDGMYLAAFARFGG